MTMGKSKKEAEIIPEAPPQTWTATERDPDTGMLKEKREGGNNEPVSETPAASDQE
jgi:hypothetical protein